MRTEDITELLGGAAVLESGISSDIELVAAVREGLPAGAMEAIVEKGALSTDEVEHLVLAEGTVAERALAEKVTPVESDRLARVARITALANETFGDSAKAARWLRKPARALGGVPPIELLSSGEGARLVEDSLEQIANGIFA